jgi:uncharacterized protein (TIGR02996 family)
MTPDESFLCDILSNPDDDGLRLIYADWLDDHRQPDRAAFIRVQIELARLPEDSLRLVERRKELETRERVLLSKHEEEWAGPLRWLLAGMLTGFEFRRGFIEGVTLDTPGLLGTIDGLFQLAPLRDLTVTPAPGQVELPRFLFVDRLIEQLAHLPPAFAGLRTLNLHGNAIHDAGARALASSPHLSGLTGLTLSENRIRDTGVRALAASANLPRLGVLDLSGNFIESPGAWALARSASLASLASLELGGNPILEEGREALRARFGDRVHF